MATAIELLICGCPVEEEADTGHRPDCWMGKAENIAEAAIKLYDACPRPGGRTVAVLQALDTAGYLAGVAPGQQLFGLLDYLAEADLLAAPDGA
jgi:hypothetical protein